MSTEVASISLMTGVRRALVYCSGSELILAGQDALVYISSSITHSRCDPWAK